MGLGLAISRTIVEAHGGHIWATRNPTVGMTFTFTLPTGEKDENRDEPSDSLRGG
jgi:signal transduction histidine kinase